MQNATKPTSNQDAFDRVYRHFMTEKNPRCLNLNGTCANRNAAHTNGCAIGCMLPDRLWSADGNALPYQTLLSRPGVATWFFNVDTGLLYDLQALHDVDYLSAEAFKRIVVKFDLRCPRDLKTI